MNYEKFIMRNEVTIVSYKPKIEITVKKLWATVKISSCKKVVFVRNEAAFARN